MNVPSFGGVVPCLGSSLSLEVIEPVVDIVVGAVECGNWACDRRLDDGDGLRLAGNLWDSSRSDRINNLWLLFWSLGKVCNECTTWSVAGC